jgi:nicotinamide riboside kinase
MKSKKLIVVNLIGGPGVGKSILASDLFSALKKKNISCDVSWEYIKKKLREKSLKAVESQIYIFGKQQFQLFTLKGEVDVAITDSPILLNSIYDKSSCPSLKGLILKEFAKYNNLTYCINRDYNYAYEEEGRYQNEEQAKIVDQKVIEFLNDNSIPYKTIKGIGEDSLKTIINDVLNTIKENEAKN